MIRCFRHKRLKLLFEEGSKRRIGAEHADKIARILARLDEAADVQAMDLPGFRLHALKGDLAGCWARIRAILSACRAITLSISAGRGTIAP